jgi:hypothetical protein
MVLVRACSFTVWSSARDGAGVASAMLAGQRYGIVTAQTTAASPVSYRKGAVNPTPKTG